MKTFLKLPLFLQQTLIYLLLTLGYLSASSLAAWVLVTYSSIGEAAFPGYTKHHLVTSTVTTTPLHCTMGNFGTRHTFNIGAKISSFVEVFGLNDHGWP